MGLLRERYAGLKKGTSAILLQSGLDGSMECYCCLRNMQVLLFLGKTSAIRSNFKEPVIPFGSMIDCRFISVKDLSRLRQFGKKILPARFLGYVKYAGRIWKGDMMVADI